MCLVNSSSKSKFILHVLVWQSTSRSDKNLALHPSQTYVVDKSCSGWSSCKCSDISSKVSVEWSQRKQCSVTSLPWVTWRRCATRLSWLMKLWLQFRHSYASVSSAPADQRQELEYIQKIQPCCVWVGMKCWLDSTQDEWILYKFKVIAYLKWKCQHNKIVNWQKHVIIIV